MTRRRSVRGLSGAAWAGVVAGAGVAAGGPAGAPLILGEVTGFDAATPAMARTPDDATWVAWISNQCFGALRVQRIDADGSLLTPGGLELDLQDDCNSFRAIITPCPDDSVVAAGAPHPFPVRRIDANGAAMWGDGVLVSETAPVGGVLGLPDGDVLITWHAGSTILVARHDTAGAAVWPAPASIVTVTGSNKRIFALLPDGSDGAYVLWDEPNSYTRSIWISRVSGAGQPVWDDPFNVVPTDGPPSFSGSSRHTDPVAVVDGNGGVVLVWTFGAESSLTIVPLLMQIVNPDGTRAFEPEGRRVALQLSRQYDPVLARDDAGGAVFVAWRDGGFDAQTLRAQRMTLAGARAWGDDGVAVTPLATGGTSWFTASWSPPRLALPVSRFAPAPGDASVVMHRLDADGNVDDEAIPVSGALPAGPVSAVPLNGATMVSWLEEPADGHVLARGIDDGAAPVLGDANGDGVVNVVDLNAVIIDWGTDGAANGGDVNGDGTVDVNDLLVVIRQWT